MHVCLSWSSVVKTSALAGGVVGGVVGAVALTLILVLVFRRRMRANQERIDLLHGHVSPGTRPSSGASRGDLFQTYRVEPFGVDPVSQLSPHGYGSESDPRTSTRTSTTDLLQSGTRSSFPHGTMSPASGGSRSKAPVNLRPVNIMEHTDAGPDQTVELPPAYTHIRRHLTSQ